MSQNKLKSMRVAIRLFEVDVTISFWKIYNKALSVQKAYAYIITGGISKCDIQLVTRRELYRLCKFTTQCRPLGTDG